MPHLGPIAMAPGHPPDVALYCDRIAAAAPDLADKSVRVIADGWDSVALEVDSDWIFKFPRKAEAEIRLRREQSLLALIRPRLTLPVPDMVLHENGGAFSQHRKLPGRALETPEYEALPEDRRAALAQTLAQLYAELHAIPIAEAEAAGARSIDLRLAAPEMLRLLRPKLPPQLQDFLETTMAAYAALSDEPPETIYGYFDGHGWNMAFDHDAQTLNGVFDFADSGIGPRHRDLSYGSWIDPELSRKAARRYAALTGYPIDPERVVLHNSALRLSEYAEGVLERVVADPIAAIEDYVRRLGAAP